MSSYFLALINIHDPEEYEKYLSGYDRVFSRFKGEIIAVEDQPRVLEGKWPSGRTVLIRFPGDEDLLRWYESPEYRELARHRRNASDAKIAIISGRD
ncbi:MAG: DUF1330 domain-containing protein [bacterium]|nr:DUF1330 domain-containing protein [bacterium]